MKKLITSFLVLFFAAISIAADIQPYSFPFIGKWNPSEDPMLIDDYGFQDIQNLRKEGKHFKGVKGHSKINTTALSDLYVVNGFHFKKDTPQESHVIVYAGDATTPTTGHLYKNTTAIPSAGDFSATTLYTPTVFTDTFRFSNAPSGNMVSSNAAETLIWGGAETSFVTFFTSGTAVTYAPTNSNDYSDILNNTSQLPAQIANLTAAADAATVLLLHMNGTDASTTFTDSASGTKAVTAVGNAQIDTSQQKLGTASGLFDGTGDYLTTPDHADFNFGTNPFSIDYWVRATFGSWGNHGIIGQYQDSDNYWHLKTSIQVTEYYVYFKVVVAGVTKADYTWTVPFVTGDEYWGWNHFALVRNGTSLVAYFNGSALSVTETTAIAANAMPDLTGNIEIGACTDHTILLNGWLDELRVSKGVARWTGNFVVPSQEYMMASNYFLIGVRRPIQGAKFYISTGNTAASTLTVKEWTGSAWSSLNITGTDNTVVTGKTLATTGTVTWPSTVNTSKPRYINGYVLYWYQFYFDAGSASIYYVTVDAPIQTIKNNWDGVEMNAARVKKYDGSTYTDSASIFNAEAEDLINLVGDNDDNTYADFSSLASANQTILIGFTERQQGFDFRFVPLKINSTDNTNMTVKYWSGSAWVVVNALYDQTATSNKSFNKNGVVIFSPVAEGQEFTTVIGDDYPLYYYQISFAANLSANVFVSELRGIPVPATIPSYKFSATFQNRLFLFAENGGKKNVVFYSAYNSPDIFTGSDAGYINFDEETTLTAAVPIYNVFNTTGGIEQLIVTKANETFRVTGNNPDTWSVQKISTNVGCVAPLTMVAADMMELDTVKRQVAIWMSAQGVFVSDGATVRSISDDIKCYFNPGDDRYIPAAMQSKSVGWYDTSLKSYKLLVASGASATYLNTELEYSLKNQEWTKVYRETVATANPLQSGWTVTDTNGGSYTYGGGKNGLVYRLENSNRWDGTRITSYLHTKDLIIDQANPLFRTSTVKYIRTAYKKKQTGAVTIEHFGDGIRTTSGVDGQEGPATITAAEMLALGYNTQSTLLGPYLYHSFKFQATTNIEDGLELTGFGIYYEPFTAIR